MNGTKAVTLMLLLTGTLMLAFNIQPAKASGTLYISSDYTFTSNIYEPIVVTADNIVIDGAGYTVQGPGWGIGIDLRYRTNVLLKNVEVTSFSTGIYLRYSDSNVLSGNTVSNINFCGIFSVSSNNNVLSGNNASNIGEVSPEGGIYLADSSNNVLSGNTVSNNAVGIYLVHSSGNILSGNTASLSGYYGIAFGSSSNNVLSGNTVSNNAVGIFLQDASNNNSIFHNDIMENGEQVIRYTECWNTWDNGYPSGGNYWSDYTTRYPAAQELDGSGIWDTPYIIDGNNQDSYPLMNPCGVSPEKAVEDLIGYVGSMNLQLGLDNSLDAKLDVALRSLEAVRGGRMNDAVNILCAFVREVEAQRGNRITNGQADFLISEAQRTIELIEALTP